MTVGPSRRAPRWLIPEVVQTSAMDCGPASLKALLGGFGIPVSYGRLREACQTSLDGTSIDTLEEIAVQVGLPAEQRVVPADLVLLPETAALPAVVVVRLPNGFTHFVVAWRRIGSFVQVMDPGIGRRWLPVARFLADLYIHIQAVDADAWRMFASSGGFIAPLRRRLGDLGVPERGRALVTHGLEDPGWRSLAALDAAARMLASVVRSGGLRPGPQCARVLEHCYRAALAEPADDPQIIPGPYWSVRPSAPDPETAAPRVQLHGAVLIAVSPPPSDVRDADLPPVEAPPEDAEDAGTDVPAETAAPAMSAELAAALNEAPSSPGRDLVGLLRADGWLAPAALALGLTLAVASTVVEAVVFRAVLDVGRYLGIGPQRAGAAVVLLLFLLALLLLEYPLALGLARIGRRLEARLRMAFLTKIPRLGDRYFQSRPTSDMAERSHAVHQLRTLPPLGGQLVRAALELVVTAVGLAWLDPPSAPAAAAAALLAVALPLAVQRPLSELDLRLRSHGGGLARFYLDALQGLVAVRTHGAERSVRREHESLLVEWARAGRNLQRAAVAIEGVEAVLGFGLTAVLLHGYLSRTGSTGGALLLVYWALNIPALGQEVAQLARQYPDHRNVTLRLLEPLGALEDGDNAAEPGGRPGENTLGVSHGAAIALEGVTVRAGGHTILEGVDLAVGPGEHVAVVGPSGAGKSSLVGLLLGWHRPAAGTLRVDGEALEGARLAALRRATAWVDPAVQLWNRSFLDNLRYGSGTDAPETLGTVLSAADLRSVLERLPDGLQTRLGEGGGLVSGGEGQRVRLGRAMLRADARLVILDEPFRGLDRDKRRALLARARTLWADATLVCITHDVGETAGFPRVLVVDGGRVVEDAAPEALAADPGSRYSALLAAEHTVREGLWSSAVWRRLRMEDGRVDARGEDGDKGKGKSEGKGGGGAG